jgi:type IV pilus assembly protein PilA
MSRLSVPAHRAFTLVEIMVVVVIISLLAMLAIPGFQKVRLASQDKAVLNNARLLAAADQYMMQEGATAVTITALVGPTNLIKFLNVVAGESYPEQYTQGVTITISGIAGARTITYGL